MFLALHDIRFAKGRFALMTAVVALVTLLLVMLSSLTRGLGEQSTSAVAGLPPGRLLLAPSGSTTSWADSVITPQLADAAHRADPDAEALALGRARATRGEAITSPALIGVEPGGRSMAALGTSLSDDQVVLPQQVADELSLAPGQALELNGKRLVVAAVQPTRWYSHSPVVWTTLATANRLTGQQAGQATAVLSPGTSPAPAALTALDRGDALAALPGYSSERGSLLMIQGFLYGVTALVVLAFLSVWTIQRTRDIAVLRALGGSRGYVLRDSLGQAAILLGTGCLLGGALGTAAALAARQAVPVLVLPATTLAPTVGVLVVGLLGSVLAVRRVTAVDPLLALGGN